MRTWSTLHEEERPFRRMQRLLSSPNQDGSHNAQSHRSRLTKSADGSTHSSGPTTMCIPHLRWPPQGNISPCSQYNPATPFLGAKSYWVSTEPGLYQQLGPSPHKPAALGLLGVPRRFYPRPHDFAVLGGPPPRTHERVIRLVNRVLQAVDLLLGERQRVHE